MRLTKKKIICSQNTTYEIISSFECDRGTGINAELIAIDKLGQLEDIEDELGIDLITYVKLTTQPVLYIKNVPFNNEPKVAFMEAITTDDKSKEYIAWFSCGKGKKYIFRLKDYKINWALTKEELL